MVEIASSHDAALTGGAMGDKFNRFLTLTSSGLTMSAKSESFGGDDQRSPTERQLVGLGEALE